MIGKNKMGGIASTWKIFKVHFDTRTAEMSSRLRCDTDLEQEPGGFTANSLHVHWAGAIR